MSGPPDAVTAADPITPVPHRHRGIQGSTRLSQQAAPDMSFAREEWMESSKCLDLPVHEADLMFFPLDANNNWPAIRFCNGDKEGKGRCPVISECLDYALRTDTRHGVWGGMTPNKRGKLAGVPDEVGA